MGTPAFWLDVLKTLIGAFAGAGLAFASNYFFQSRQRLREQYGAGQVALVTLHIMLRDTVELAKSFNQVPVPPNDPPWRYSCAIAYPMDEGLAFDFESLSFLSWRDPGLLPKLATAQQSYASLRQGILEHRVLREKIEEKYAAAGVSTMQSDYATSKRLVGEAVIAKADDVSLALLSRLRHPRPLFENLGEHLVQLQRAHFHRFYRRAKKWPLPSFKNVPKAPAATTESNFPRQSE